MSKQKLVTTFKYDSPYWSVPIYRLAINMVCTELYRRIDTRYDGTYQQAGMYRPYRSLVRSIHTVRTGRHTVVRQILLLSTTKQPKD